MSIAKRINRLWRETERLRQSLSEGSKWARSADEHILRHCDAIKGIDAEQTDIVAAQDAMSTKLDRMHGDLGRIFDRLAKAEAKEAEHAATVATIVDGLGRLERRVSKKGQPVDEPVHRPCSPGCGPGPCPDCESHPAYCVCEHCEHDRNKCDPRVCGLCPDIIDDPATGCPCCPGAEHDGGQTFDVAYANMRRTRAEVWEYEGGACHMGNNGMLFHPDGRRWGADNEAVLSTRWRKR